jgi:intron-binding protein aquarius
LEVLPPKVGEEKPAAVRAEVSLDLTRVSPDVRKEWESLRPDDVVFLLGIKGADESDKMITNGGPEKMSLVEKYGIKCLRAAEVVSVLDSQGRQIGSGENRVKSSGGQCRLHLHLDTDMYEVCWPNPSWRHKLLTSNR